MKFFLITTVLFTVLMCFLWFFPDYSDLEKINGSFYLVEERKSSYSLYYKIPEGKGEIKIFDEDIDGYSVNKSYISFLTELGVFYLDLKDFELYDNESIYGPYDFQEYREIRSKNKLPEYPKTLKTKPSVNQ